MKPSVHPDVLRIVVFAIGSVLVGLAGAPMALEASGVHTASIFPPGWADIALALGTYLVGYSKTARSLGDLSAADHAVAIAGELFKQRAERESVYSSEDSKTH